MCSDDVEPQQEIVEEKQEIRRNIHESLLDEMKKSDLHNSSETRNAQEKVDKMSAEKSQQKEELNEMQHTAQVCGETTGGLDWVFLNIILPQFSSPCLPFSITCAHEGYLPIFCTQTCFF